MLTDKTQFPVSRGMVYMLLAAVFFSVMTVCVKLLGPLVPAAEVVFFRSLISLALTFPVLRQKGLNVLGNRRGLLALRGAVGFLALLCFYFAIPRMPLADVTVIQYTNPVFVAILAAILLHEQVGLREILSVVASLAGVTIIARPGFIFGSESVAVDPAVTTLALTGAILAAVAYTLVRKLGETEHSLVIVLYFPLVSVPASVPFMWSTFVWPSPRQWLLLLGIGATTQVAQVFMTRGLQIEPAARATAVSYVQIVFATAWGMALFGEIPDLPTAVGAGMVMVGVLSLGYGKRLTAKSGQ